MSAYNEHAARHLAAQVAIIDVSAGLLPQDKTVTVRELKGQGRRGLGSAPVPGGHPDRSTDAVKKWHAFVPRRDTWSTAYGEVDQVRPTGAMRRLAPGGAGDRGGAKSAAPRCMLVGDLQRVIEYPKLGFAIEQEVPVDVHAAYESLIRDDFTSRLIS